MPLELSQHIVAARNLFFGTSYFVILSLPNGWAITRSYLEPDVHSRIQRENLTWVEAGQTDRIVFNPVKKIALDLMIQVKRGKHENTGIQGRADFLAGLKNGLRPSRFLLYRRGQTRIVQKEVVQNAAVFSCIARS